MEKPSLNGCLQKTKQVTSLTEPLNKYLANKLQVTNSSSAFVPTVALSLLSCIFGIVKEKKCSISNHLHFWKTLIWWFYSLTQKSKVFPGKIKYVLPWSSSIQSKIHFSFLFHYFSYVHPFTMQKHLLVDTGFWFWKNAYTLSRLDCVSPLISPIKRNNSMSIPILPQEFFFSLICYSRDTFITSVVQHHVIKKQ